MSLDAHIRVGRYELYGLISAGGTARVHFGRQLGAHGFERVVAIKSVHPGLVADAGFRAMLEDEARLLSRIHHANVITPLDVVLTESELFLVLEYIPGDTLAGLLAEARRRKEALPFPAISRMMSDVLRGLHAAHEARDQNEAPLNVIHRDVSPENILAGIDGVTRVFDFGIAKAANRSHTTEEGFVKGKVAYMAPEQLADTEVDRRVDIYAAGVVLWEALTSKRLFRSETPGALFAEVMVGVTKPPSAHRSDVPTEIDELVMRALSAVPAARFDTALEMAEAIERAVPPMRPDAFAEWIAAWVPQALEERAAKVAAIENDEAPVPQESVDGAPAVGSAADNLPTEPDHPVQTRDRRRLGIFAALVLLVAGGAFFLVRPNREPEPPSANLVAPPAEIRPSEPLPPPTDPPRITEDESPPPLSSGIRLRHAPKVRPRDCRVPYVIDGTGHKVYRRECL